MITMRRTENVAWIRPEEVFYDGVLPVHDDQVVIPDGKEHWELQLILWGWERVEESVDEVAPKGKRKATNGKDSQ